MPQIKNVAIAGATGTLGTPILHALIASNLFTITVLTRPTTQATFPPNITVTPVSYDSITDLIAALTNQDALISVLPDSAIPSQTTLIQACVRTGVKRFIPSEFSADVGNPLAATLPVYHSRILIHGVLEKTAQENPGFTYSLLRHGPFLDWSLGIGALVDFKSETPAFYDGGDRPFSATTLGSIGRAVVGVLSHVEETKNRAVYVHDLVTSQREILGLARKVAPGRVWRPVLVSTAQAEEKGRAEWAAGRRDLGAMLGMLVRAIFAEGYGGEFGTVDNEVLGLGFMGVEELEGLVRGVLV
ncbi:hypothetical protein BDV25DRAFT_172398 [Aspergillus avenaceus]|uniref:NmrA-like domain-containing protein n=1 Tax=Aspergillus avenaceus TaxID=36643 RepID=A0A5N6U6Z2_ASPAV|nr:hypothetical protein BDV25DRAFT_172398 [Aspergillus avenaceus]